MKITNITYYDTESLRPLIELAYNLTWSGKATGPGLNDAPYKFEEVKIIVSYFAGDLTVGKFGSREQEESHRPSYAYAKSKDTWSRDPRSVLHVALRRKNKMFDGELAHLAASRSGDLPIEASTDFVKAVMGEMTGRYQARRIIDTHIWPGDPPHIRHDGSRLPNSEYAGGEVTLSPIKVHARATKGSAQVWQLITAFKSWNREARNESSLLYEMGCLQERMDKVKEKKLKQSQKWQKARLVLAKHKGLFGSLDQALYRTNLDGPDCPSVQLANKILVDTGLMEPHDQDE